MKLTIVRHGKPAETGDADPPLTAEGKAQAEAAARALSGRHFDAVVCSPSLRARETAAPFLKASGMTPTIDERLTEIDYGDEEYIRVDEARARGDAVWETWRARLVASVDNEPYEAAFVGQIKASMKELNAAYADKEVLVFAHGGVVNVLAGWSAYSKRLWIMLPDYCGISRFGFRKGHPLIQTLNDINHMSDFKTMNAAHYAAL